MLIGLLPSRAVFAEDAQSKVYEYETVFEDDCSDLSNSGWTYSAPNPDGSFISNYTKDENEVYRFHSDLDGTYSLLITKPSIGNGLWYAEFDMSIDSLMTPKELPEWVGFTFDFIAAGMRYKIAFNSLDSNGDMKIYTVQKDGVVLDKTVTLPDNNMHKWKIAYLGDGKLAVYMDGNEVALFNGMNWSTTAGDMIIVLNSTKALQSGSNEVYMDNFKLAKAVVKPNVYYVAPDGNNENQGTIDAPFKTVSYATKQLNPGDTLYIRGGLYNEYLVMIGKGSDSDPRPITIKNYEGEKVTLINSVNASLQYITYIGTCKNLVFSGLTLTNEGAVTENGQQMNNYLAFIDNSSNIKFENCTFYKSGGALVFRSGTRDCEVTSCVFHDLGYPYGGVLLYNGIQNVSIYNNLFYNNFYGVEFLGDGGNNTTNNKVYNNTFKGNVNDIGANQSGGTPEGNIISNNIFSSNFEIIVSGQENVFLSNNSFDYNVYNSNTFNDVVAGIYISGKRQELTFDEFKAMGNEEHGIKGDPCFRDSDNNDFELQEGSVCCNAGTAEYTPLTDMLGRAREGINDIGAYKYTGSRLYYVSPDGNNSNDGSFAAPFSSIQHAVDTANPVDMIMIKGGTYNENVNVFSKDNIIIKNYNDEKAAITGNLTVTSSSNIVLQGLSLAGQTPMLIDNSRDIRLTGLDTASGISVSNTNQYEISSSFVHNSQNPDGAIVLNNSTNGKVFDNVIYNNAVGICINHEESTLNEVVNNTFYNNQNGDVSIVADTENNIFKNNIFSSGLILDSMDVVSGNVFNYNCYNNDFLSNSIGKISGNYDNGLTLDQFKALGAEEHGFLGNPEFYDAMSSDFRITTYSDCRSKGQLVSFAAKDINGITRNSPVDVGAYAYDGLKRTYYISPDGNDENTGSMNYPFRTIQHGIDSIKPGETLIIRDGTYKESLDISNKTGSTSLGYILKAYDGEEVVIDLSGMDKAYAIRVTNSSDWTIENINLNNINQYGFSLLDSQNITIKSGSISGNGISGIYGTNITNCAVNEIEIKSSANGTINKGIYMANSSGCTVDKCIIDLMGEEGIYFEAGNANSITAGIITGNSTGIAVADSTGCIVYNNTLYNNSNNDMAFSGAATGNIVKNNIFGSVASTTTLKLASGDSINNDFNYNLYNKLETDNIAEHQSTLLTIADFRNIGKEANSVLGNPGFYDAQNGDFYLQKGSPCIEAGIKDANTPAAGFDGVAFGIPVDIGALYCPLSYRVYYVSPDGDDSNDGSFEHPWKTLKKGMLSIKPTDTLYLREGIYKERVNLYDKQSGKYKGEQLWYTLENYPGETAILDSDYTEDVAIKLDRCSYWKIKGLKICEYTGTGIWTSNNTEHVILDGLEIYDIASPEFDDYGITGILGNVGNYITVKNCHIHDISAKRRSPIDHGIYLGYGAHHWIIDSNIIHDTPGAGIQFNGAPSAGCDSIVTNNIVYNNKFGMIVNRNERTVISNNTLYNNWYNDIYLDWFVHNIIIQNNIIYNDYAKGAKVITADRANGTMVEVEVSPSVFGIYCEEVTGNIIRNNIYKYVNYEAGVRSMNFYSDPVPVAEYLSSQSQNQFIDFIEQDPMIADAQNGNFGLQDSSPCIDAGLVENAPDKDYFGNDRLGKPDMGAVEWGITIKLIHETMEDYIESGDLKGPLINQLTNDLNQAEHQLSKASTEKAIKHMEDFIKHLCNEALEENVSVTAKEVLVTEVNELIGAWRNE